MKALICFKNGFGDQLIQVAFGLSTKLPLLFIRDIRYKHINGFYYSSILPQYLTIQNYDYSSIKDLNINLQENRQDYFKSVIKDNYFIIGNEKYFNQPPFNKVFPPNFNYINRILLLKKYCKIDIKDYPQLNSYTGFHIRFMSNKWKEVVDNLNNIKNTNIYITSDNGIMCNRYLHIHKSNNVIFDIKNYTNIIDCFDSPKSEEEYIENQKNDLIIASKLASCKSFIKTNNSNFSLYVVPLIRYSHANNRK